MSTGEVPRLLLAQAELIMEEARSLADKGAWALVVRRSQEVVELALKAALRWTGLEAPQVHDVGGILRRHSTRFPASFAAHTRRLAHISDALATKRGPSFYGDEASGKAPQDLFDEPQAREALAQAGEVLAACRPLFPGAP